MPGNYEIPSLTGERVALRPIEPEEEAIVHQWGLESDPLALTSRLPRLQARSRAAGSAARRREGADRASLAVALRGTGTLVGRVRYFDLNPRNRSVEIAYLLAPGARGKGFGREAVSLLLGHLFDGLGCNRVLARTSAGNRRSVALLESLGFQRDGVLRDQYFLEGRFQDGYLYTLLAREWRERQQKTQ